MLGVRCVAPFWWFMIKVSLLKDQRWNLCSQGIFDKRRHFPMFLCTIPLFSNITGCHAIPHSGIFPPAHLQMWALTNSNGYAALCIEMIGTNLFIFLVHFIAFWYISLHFGTFQCISLHFGIFQCISLHCGIFQCILLHFGKFQCSSLHFGTFQFISLHVCTFNWNWVFLRVFCSSVHFCCNGLD